MKKFSDMADDKKLFITGPVVPRYISSMIFIHRYYMLRRLIMRGLRNLKII